MSSDYLLHKHINKHSIYSGNSNLWWSEELNRWMCSNPTIAKSILSNTNFTVHDYKIDSLLNKFDCELHHIARIAEFLPIAHDGERHTQLRKLFAVEMFKQSDKVLSIFSNDLENNMKLFYSHDQLDLVTDILRAPLRNALLRLCNIEGLNPSLDFDSISQLLDETLSLNKRVQINRIINEIISIFPDSMGDDEKYLRISMLALGTDALIGTITESIFTILSNNNTACSEINWNIDIPSTGVPVIERNCVKDCIIGDNKILSGQRIRIYLDAAGYNIDSGPSYSSLYFSAGPHTCLGMPIGKKIWHIVTRQFALLNKKIIIQNQKYRTPDCVFNIYENILVNVYE